eukprot:XP_020400200.1 heat shock 70 kDa protein 14 [Zea mays]
MVSCQARQSFNLFFYFTSQFHLLPLHFQVPEISNSAVELNGVLLNHALVTFRELLLKCAQHYSWYVLRAIYVTKGSKLLPPSFASIFYDSASSVLDVFFDPSDGSLNVPGLTIGMFKFISKNMKSSGFSGTKRYLGDLGKTVKTASSNALFAAVTEISDSVVRGAETNGLNGMVTGFPTLFFCYFCMQMLEEDVAVPVSSANEAPKDTTKMDTDDAPSDPVSGTDVNVHEPDTTEAAPAAENGAENPEEKSVPMETDAKVEPSERKVKRTSVPVHALVYGALAVADLQKAVEKEYEMALQDRVMEETKEKKNVVEAYVYDMRNKLYDRYNDFVTPEEKEGLIGKLREVEDWLYEDGEDETKGVYISKLEDLKKIGDPIEARYKESTERGSSVDQLVYCINSFREAALSSDQKFGHIDISEKQKVGQSAI